MWWVPPEMLFHVRFTGSVQNSLVQVLIAFLLWRPATLTLRSSNDNRPIGCLETHNSLCPFIPTVRAKRMWEEVGGKERKERVRWVRIRETCILRSDAAMVTLSIERDGFVYPTVYPNVFVMTTFMLYSVNNVLFSLLWGLLQLKSCVFAQRGSFLGHH